jgi:tetratricopeptide (TPR) repeat protein
LYDEMRDYTRAEPLWREALRIFKDDENVTVDVQASLGLCLLKSGKPADAEPVLRQCLVTRENNDLNDLTTFNTKSLLGAALLGQKKYADAEPLLLAGYEGMKKREDKIPPQGKVRLTEAAERLVQIYEATEQKEKAAEWRKELEAVKGAEPQVQP